MTAIATLPAGAQLNGDGYYRGKNYLSERYIYVIDDKGKVNTSTTNADVLALDLWKNFLKASSDPSTVLYIHGVGNKKYDIAAQGTAVHTIIDYYVSIAQNGSGPEGPTYMVYGTKSGATKYLGDAEGVAGEQGEMSTNAQGDKRKWYIVPLNDAGSDSYFGVKPTITVGGKYYQPFYAGFPCSAYSQGVKFHKIVRIDGDVAVIEEITGTVAAGEAVIVECANPLATDNRLNIGGTASKASDNLLAGVYFDNPMKLHYNRTKYDPQTMRRLKADANGKLVYYTDNIEFLPRNESYLKVPKGTPATLRVMTREEYEAEQEAKKPTGITLSKGELAMTEGENTTLTATVTPATADATVTWSSSAAGVAAVSDKGVVTAVAPGTAEITAKTVNGLTAVCKVTVRQAERPAVSVAISATSLNVDYGDTFTLSATVMPANCTDKNLTWTSSDEKVVAVTGATAGSAEFRATGGGNAVITVTTANGRKATCSVAVSRKAESVEITTGDLTLKPGETAKAEVKVGPDDANAIEYLWESSDETVATVDADGNVRGIAPGSCTVTVTVAEGVKDSITVTVPEDVKPEVTEIALDTRRVEAEVGDRLHLVLTMYPEEADVEPVAWNVSDERVLSISNGDSYGCDIEVISEGVATVKVVTENGLTAECEFVVASGIESVFDENGVADVYTSTGILIRKDADADYIGTLRPGLYIIGGRKVVL